MDAPNGAAIAAGRLLVATPTLEDPNFRRSVVLILDHDEDDSTLGVVLNRPTEVEVSQVLEGWAEVVTKPAILFQGGPVALDSALAVGRLPVAERRTAGPPGWRALNGTPDGGRVGLVDLDAPPALLAGELLQLRVFAGYSGWGGGQLKSEVEDGAWFIVPSEPGDAFTDSPDRLWQQVLRRQRNDLALVATFPDDPTLN